LHEVFVCRVSGVGLFTLRFRALRLWFYVCLFVDLHRCRVRVLALTVELCGLVAASVRRDRFRWAGCGRSLLPFEIRRATLQCSPYLGCGCRAICDVGGRCGRGWFVVLSHGGFAKTRPLFRGRSSMICWGLKKRRPTEHNVPVLNITNQYELTRELIIFVVEASFWGLAFAATSNRVEKHQLQR
jgi:hypothetical protein